MHQVVDRQAIMQLRADCREVLVAPHVQEYAIDLVMATQPGTPQAHALANKYIRYGSSRAARRHWWNAAACWRLCAAGCNLSVDDVVTVAPAVLRHRIILNFDAHADGQTPETILD